MHPVFLALAGTTFTFLTTALGAAAVFFFQNEIPHRLQRAFLGFAAGVMIAASVWSLLIPAMDFSEKNGVSPCIPAAGGFLVGAIFLLVLDVMLSSIRRISLLAGQASKGTIMLFLAVTLHNIPEGLAVGLALGLAGENSANSLAGALALCLGMALQNFPEGAALSLPLKKEGFSNKRSFLLGALSGIVEPIAGVAGVVIAATASDLMPWFLSFAAGAMIYVVIEELIPEAQCEGTMHSGTLGAMLGFLIMMVLDTALN